MAKTPTPSTNTEARQMAPKAYRQSYILLGVILALLLAGMTLAVFLLSAQTRLGWIVLFTSVTILGLYTAWVMNLYARMSEGIYGSQAALEQLASGVFTQQKPIVLTDELSIVRYTVRKLGAELHLFSTTITKLIKGENGLEVPPPRHANDAIGQIYQLLAEKAKKERATAEQTRRIEFFMQRITHAATNHAQNQIGTEVVQLLGRFFDGSSIGLYEPEATEDKPQLKLIAGIDGKKSLPEVIKWKEGPAGRALALGKSFQEPENATAASALAIPLQINGESQGVLFLLLSNGIEPYERQLIELAALILGGQLAAHNAKINTKALQETITNLNLQINNINSEIEANKQTTNTVLENTFVNPNSVNDSTQTTHSSILQTAIDAFTLYFTTDANNIILEANQNVCTTLGYSLEELQGRHISAIMPEAATLFSTSILSGEIECSSKEGKRIALRLHVTPLTLDSERSETHTVQPAYVALGIDISSDLALERKLQNREEELAALYTAVEVVEQQLVDIQLDLASQIHALNNIALVTELDANGNVTFMNDHALERYGYSRAEVIGHYPSFLDSGLHPVEFYENLWATVRSGNVWQGELINRSRNGEFITEFHTLMPVLDRNQIPYKFIGISIEPAPEIQEVRLRLEAEVNELKAQIAKLNANAKHDAIHPEVLPPDTTQLARINMLEQALLLFEIDNMGRIVRCGSAFSNWLGVQADELVGVSITALAEPDTPAALWEQLVQTLRKGESWTGHLVCLRSEARKSPISLTITPLPYNDSVYTDNAESAAQYIGLIVEENAIGAFSAPSTPVSNIQTLPANTKAPIVEINAMGAICETDLKGVIRFVNEGFLRITRYDLQDVLGKNINILKSGIHPESVYQNLWDTINRGNIWTGTLVNKNRYGELYRTTLHIVPVLNEELQPIRFVSIAFDTTDARYRVERNIELFSIHTPPLNQPQLPATNTTQTDFTI